MPGILELDLLLGQAGFLALLGNQEALGDLHLLELGVARKPDHFHAILQGRRNGVHHVRRGDEKYLAQIVFDVQIMIHEHEILFRIEHFEQRRRRVAAEIGGHLVDFVQHEHRIAHAGLLHHLDESGRAARRCRCGGGRELRLHRARRRATGARICVRSPWRSTCRATFFPRPEARRSTGSNPWDLSPGGAPPEIRGCAP